MTANQDLFDTLPSESKIWIHVTSRKLTKHEAETLKNTVQDFSSRWTSHERPVLSDFTLLDDQILVLGAFVSNGDLSGCGIDKHEHILATFAADFKFGWAGPLTVTYRNITGQFNSVTRAEFKQLVLTESLPDSTPVVDRSVTSLTDARTGVVKPASESWHGNHFPFSANTSDVILD